MNNRKRLNLDDIVFIGRTFDEYIEMFDLNIEYLKGKKILDCPGGACSFVAGLNKRNISGVASDILYGLDSGILRKKCQEDLEKVIDVLPGAKDLYKWDFYGDVEGLKKKRVEAYEAFIEDYEIGLKRGRYVKAELPYLPFKDEEFSLVLSAHFLFLYSDRLDYDFHLRSIKELIRVASKEVRIFPLLGLDSRKYLFLNKIVEDIKNTNLSVDIIQTSFEFQIGGNEALRILKNKKRKDA